MKRCNLQTILEWVRLRSSSPPIESGPTYVPSLQPHPHDGEPREVTAQLLDPTSHRDTQRISCDLTFVKRPTAQHEHHAPGNHVPGIEDAEYIITCHDAAIEPQSASAELGEALECEVKWHSAAACASRQWIWARLQARLQGPRPAYYARHAPTFDPSLACGRSDANSDVAWKPENLRAPRTLRQMNETAGVLP